MSQNVRRHPNLTFVHVTAGVNWKNLVLYLEAEQSDGVDDVVLSGGADGWKNRGHVVHPETEEEKEAQQMAPDIHCLIGQNEEAAERIWKL